MSHAEKIDEEETMTWQLENYVKSSDSKAVQLRVWAKEAKKREEEEEEEEGLFLKQRSCEKKSRNVQHITIRFGLKSIRFGC